MKTVKLIIGSTRKGRVGKPIADWLVSTAKEAGVDLQVLDLQEINLPFFDAMVPPAYMPTETEEGKAWAAQIAEADAFVFVTPEYNRSINASLKNALDYLVAEWNDKPAAIVSYGYVDGGKSATSHLKDILGWLKVQTLESEMAVQLTQETFDEQGQFKNIDEALSSIKDDFVAAVKSLSE